MIQKVGGKSIPELVALGSTQFASMPSGGAGSGAVSASAAPVQAAAKAEEKKEAPKEEEIDVDMGDLFGY